MFEGSGRFLLGDTVHQVGSGDMVVIPSWTEWSIEADTAFDLFTFSDAPIIERLRFDRTLVSEGA